MFQEQRLSFNSIKFNWILINFIINICSIKLLDFDKSKSYSFINNLNNFNINLIQIKESFFIKTKEKETFIFISKIKETFFIIES